MPTYDYECQACHHSFELFQSIKAKPVKTCPKCKKAKVKRLIGTGGGILFKGTGFYQTDYRSSKYHEAAKKDNTSSKADSAKKDSSTSKAKKD